MGADAARPPPSCRVHALAPALAVNPIAESWHGLKEGPLCRPEAQATALASHRTTSQQFNAVHEFIPHACAHSNERANVDHQRVHIHIHAHIRSNIRVRRDKHVHLRTQNKVIDAFAHTYTMGHMGSWTKVRSSRSRTSSSTTTRAHPAMSTGESARSPGAAAPVLEVCLFLPI